MRYRRTRCAVLWFRCSLNCVNVADLSWFGLGRTANDEQNNRCRVLERSRNTIDCATAFDSALGRDGICYCSGPSTPGTPATTASTPSVTPELGCNPAASPAVKNGNVCDNLAECTALIDFSNAEANGATNCADFCANQDLACLGTHDEKRNNCRPRLSVETSCTTVIDSALGSDAICYCGIAQPTLGINPE